MNLAQVMAAHGKTLGPLGVAVYAWIDANPGATFKETADGLGMGESTVKRCVRQFEELGIARRLIKTTEKGLCEPTRIYPGTIERGTSDNPVLTDTPSPQNPSTIEPPENTEAYLSDPGTIERGTGGTKVAPSKAIRTSTDKNFNNDSNPAREAPAFAHEVSPAIQVYRDVFGTDPPPYGQDQIERDATDLPTWRATCEQWRGNNNDRTKVWNMVDAYKKRVNANANGNGREKRTNGRDDSPRADAGKNQEPPGGWQFRNTARR